MRSERKRSEPRAEYLLCNTCLRQLILEQLGRALTNLNELPLPPIRTAELVRSHMRGQDANEANLKYVINLSL